LNEKEKCTPSQRRQDHRDLKAERSVCHAAVEIALSSFLDDLAEIERPESCMFELSEFGNSSNRAAKLAAVSHRSS